ncbi:GNAT family N-acetyltransferase [Pectinatus haikarae]|uniref:RimJ/RimL family protein N-acetyltransferase n=1 Tax=Pectinatus haikarae TaxID=349096 RepID=A0ABT9Y5E6_9FIRM|nr:GNAT family protein [Pectinatus haikarae]MDQ0203060.1 RimJ/RimL family protein N-acetyltransferase [Pectinatus haikarae]
MDGRIIKKGTRIQFRQAEKDDMDYIMEVEYKPENAKFVIPYTRDVHMSTLNTKEAIHIIIETIDTKQKVGFLMIAGLDNPSKEIEFTRIILDKKGIGYGRETLKMLKSWAFDDLKFHRAWLDCKDHNERALHVYESEGFIREGFIRETILTDGVYESLVILGILDREYFAKKNKAAVL